jgi:hypothetical protein
MMMLNISPPSQDSASSGELFRRGRGDKMDVCCIWASISGGHVDAVWPEYFTIDLRWPVK